MTLPEFGASLRIGGSSARVLGIITSMAGEGALQPGKTLGGDFVIERPLGSGGMGAVYVARQLSTQRPRAIKTMHARLLSDPTLRARFAPTADWSAGEQAGVQGADAATLEALAEGNRRYLERFGHIFIVCASGLSAAEMLARLQARAGHAPEVELRVAAGEQARITRLRLEKLAP
jgi:OHCU decarboxylase